MKIAITGSSGLVGSALTQTLSKNGHSILRFVRKKEDLSDDTILWDTTKGIENPEKLNGVDVVINLAGENIATGRWTEEKKKRILESRVKGTETLCNALNTLDNPPKLLINASAIGYYGNQGDCIVNEEGPSGEGFLAKVCREWEKATESAEKKGIRVVKLRTGVVLSKKGGALAKMLLPFKLGLGGVIGSGKQWMSWIALEDLVGIVQHVIEDEAIRGPVNAVTPKAVTNYEFTKTLGKVLNRPTIFPLPAFVAKFLLGEMADEMLLSSTRVNPAVLSMTGYSFLYPDLEGAFEHILKS